MKVLLLTDADVFAGTERHIFILARALREMRVRVRVSAPRGSPLCETVRATGLTPWPIEKRGLVDPLAVTRLSRWLRRREIDVIHAHNGRTALNAVLARTLAGRGAVVMTQHFIEPSHAARSGVKGMFSAPVHRWMNKRIDRFIAISTAVGEAAIERGDCAAQRISVVPNGIDRPAKDQLRPAAETRHGLNLPAGAPFIMCAARLQPEKNLDTLISAMARVTERWPHACCLIAGRGEQRPALSQLIERLGLEGRVRLLGYRQDVQPLMAAADLVVLPARAEPFGLVLLEAMALGKAVIATRAGGPRDIVVDGETGRLVEPGDPEALAVAMNDLIADPDRRRGMGEAGQRRFEAQFTARRMAENTLPIYEAALAGVPNASPPATEAARTA